MTVMHEMEFGYEIGEEIVFHVPPRERGSTRSTSSWTIGEIVERRVANGRPTYGIRVQDDDCVRMLVVDEGAIDGTA